MGRVRFCDPRSQSSKHSKTIKLVFIDWLRPVELSVFFGNPGLVFHI